jgi:hypothetical protein
MLMSTIISIRSAISSPGRLISRDALLHWPSGGRLLWRRQPPARGCVAPSAGDRCCSDKPVRAMLADDVRLDLVAKLHRQGKSKVGEYYDRYAESGQWAFAAGMVDHRAAMLVYEREASPS